MGHNRCDMFDEDLTPEQIEARKKTQKEKERIKRNLFNALGVDKGDEHMVKAVLKELLGQLA